MELQLESDYNSWNKGTTARWGLSDINLLADVVHLDENSDNLLQERHHTDKITMTMRDTFLMKQSVDSASTVEFTLHLMTGMTRLLASSSQPTVQLIW